MNPICELEEGYKSVLQDYLAKPEEAALQRAYELGRRALADGLGVLEMAALHHKALGKVLSAQRASEESAGTVEAAESFFVESLVPFEMTHRGFGEANTALLQLNERLEEEARRIAHALHDEAGQFLACVHFELAEMDRDLSPPLHARLDGVRKLLDQVAEHLRRLSHELRPTMLDDLGLMPALEFLAEGVSQRTGLAITVQGDWGSRPPCAIETALYRIVQEALTNAAKHARATCATVQIQQQNGTIRCSVLDDGIGFDAAAAATRKGHSGLGLIGIRERLKVLGGALQITSKPGQGTELLMTIPLER